MIKIDEKSEVWQGDIWAGYSQTFNWSSDFIASRKELLFRGPRNIYYAFTPSEIQEISVAVGKFLFWTWKLRKTIRIVHNRSDIQEKFVFVAKKTRALAMLEKLKTLGYKVS